MVHGSMQEVVVRRVEGESESKRSERGAKQSAAECACTRPWMIEQVSHRNPSQKENNTQYSRGATTPHDLIARRACQRVSPIPHARNPREMQEEMDTPVRNGSARVQAEIDATRANQLRRPLPSVPWPPPVGRL